MSPPPTPRTGIWLFPVDPADALVDAVVEADRAGLDEVWIADEGTSREPMVLLAAAARLTTRIRLAIGITSPLLRHPGALAASIATVDELSGGRAILGLGVGGHLSLEPFGLTVERRVGTIADAVRTAHDVLRGRESPRYRPPAHASPPRDVPVFVGSRGEQTLRLASREADGVFLSGLPLDALGEPVAWARSVRPVHVALYASVRFRPGTEHDPTCLTGDPDAVANGLMALVARHRPDSIGLALVDGDPVDTMVGAAVETFRRYRALAA